MSAFGRVEYMFYVVDTSLGADWPRVEVHVAIIAGLGADYCS